MPSAAGVVVPVLLWLCLVLWPGARTVAGARLRRVSLAAPGTREGAEPILGADSREAPRATGRVAGRGRAAGFAVLVGSAILASFPSVGGGLAALLGAAGTYLILRLPSLKDGMGTGPGGWLTGFLGRGPAVGNRAGSDPLLPFAIDLLAVCLRAGMPTAAALRSVSSTLPGGAVAAAPGARPAAGVPAVFARVAAAAELGSDPATAWADWIGHPVYGPLARALVVTGESGSAVAGRLTAVSNQLRTMADQRALARAQRAGVTLMAPLGLCFLPAFVCLGVVPVVVGIASRVFG